MNALLEPLVALAQAGLARGGQAAGRISMAALAGVLASVAAMASIGCALTALWIIAVPHLGSAWTALVLAGVLAVLCLALLALAFAMVRRDRRPLRFEQDAAASARMFNEHKGAMMIAALIAGLGAGSGGGHR
jgi:hypothetical protein